MWAVYLYAVFTVSLHHELDMLPEVAMRTHSPCIMYYPIFIVTYALVHGSLSKTARSPQTSPFTPLLLLLYYCWSA